MEGYEVPVLLFSSSVLSTYLWYQGQCFIDFFFFFYILRTFLYVCILSQNGSGN